MKILTILLSFLLSLGATIRGCTSSAPPKRDPTIIAQPSREDSTDVEQPSAQMSSQANEQNEPTGSPYLERRRAFKTKLIHKGPSLQDWEEEPLERFVRSVQYDSDNRRLKAWVFIPNNEENVPRPALVFCHGGCASSANELLCVKPFLNGEYVVMGPTWRGENGNPGHFELMLGEVDDAVNAVKWLARQPYVDPKHIYMFGHSIGGGVSSLVSLRDDVPLRHCGSSGGLYSDDTFEGWADSPYFRTPFDYHDKMECSMRILDGHTDSMRIPHYAFLGKKDYDDFFYLPAEKYLSGKIKAPLLKIEIVPGDHFSSFGESIRRYFRLVENDRR